MLTIISGYTQLLLERHGEGDPSRGNLGEIKKAANRAATLTRQLLAFSRQQVMTPQVLELNTLIANMGKMLQRIIGEDVELVVSQGSQLGQVKADPGQIEQVIMNLAVNARDAMPRGGKLILETVNVDLDNPYILSHVPAKPGPYVLLAVSDTGTGMDAETQRHLFEPFFTTKERGKGTGLGLATVYGIVKQSAGYIWAYSEAGHGSTFKIYLPRFAGCSPAELSAPEAVERFTGTETVLVVEDEDPVRSLICEVLKSSDYTVLEANRGSEAVRIAEQYRGPIHLLITDVIMPRMSGCELVRQMGPLRPEMKVIYVSGYTDDAIVQHGLLEPGKTFLQKPFTPDALKRKVRATLEAEQTR